MSQFLLVFELLYISKMSLPFIDSFNWWNLIFLVILFSTYLFHHSLILHIPLSLSFFNPQTLSAHFNKVFSKITHPSSTSFYSTRLYINLSSPKPLYFKLSILTIILTCFLLRWKFPPVVDTLLVIATWWFDCPWHNQFQNPLHLFEMIYICGRKDGWS